MEPHELQAVKSLISAAQPFTSGTIVDETSGTIPLMEALEDAIRDVERALEQ